MDIISHEDQYRHIYKFKVLLPTRDKQLVMGIAKYAKIAGIPPNYIYQSIYDFTDNGAVDWMRGYKGHLRRGIFGACIVGGDDFLVRMSAMIGCAIRNYIDSRLMTVQEVLNAIKDGEPINFELVAVPNFFVSKQEGGDVPKWQSSLLLSWLYERYAASQQTIIYVSSVKSLGSSYGLAFRKFVEDNYEIIGG